jgi:hypothetical protein
MHYKQTKLTHQLKKGLINYSLANLLSDEGLTESTNRLQDRGFSIRQTKLIKQISRKPFNQSKINFPDFSFR